MFEVVKTRTDLLFSNEMVTTQRSKTDDLKWLRVGSTTRGGECIFLIIPRVVYFHQRQVFLILFF